MHCFFSSLLLFCLAQGHLWPVALVQAGWCKQCADLPPRSAAQAPDIHQELVRLQLWGHSQYELMPSAAESSTPVGLFMLNSDHFTQKSFEKHHKTCFFFNKSVVFLKNTAGLHHTASQSGDVPKPFIFNKIHWKINRKKITGNFLPNTHPVNHINYSDF